MILGFDGIVVPKPGANWGFFSSEVTRRATQLNEFASYDEGEEARTHARRHTDTQTHTQTHTHTDTHTHTHTHTHLSLIHIPSPRDASKSRMPSSA